MTDTLAPGRLVWRARNDVAGIRAYVGNSHPWRRNALSPPLKAWPRTRVTDDAIEILTIRHGARAT